MAVSLDTIVGPWGNNGGNFWSFRPVNKINQIVIAFSGDNNPIAITFSCLIDGAIKDTITVGGGGPEIISSTATVNIEGANEYFIGITGTIGIYLGNNVIRSIKFITNVKEYGPYGPSDGTAFNSEIPDGSKIVGFLGRSGYFVDAIGAYINIAS